jgi:hypothetical protein
VGIRDDHGTLERDGVLYVLVRQECFRLPEALKPLPGVRHSVAPRANHSLGNALQQDPDRARFAVRHGRHLAEMLNDSMQPH